MEIAILMAAGLGSRMKPLTDTTAKPLVTVNGTPLIETVLAALEKRGVAEIYVVVGYKKEQFRSLESKHPNLHLIENPEYDTKNNINSIAVAAKEMASADCFICEADLFVPSPDLLCRPLEKSGYFGKMVSGFSDDWVFETEDSLHCQPQPPTSTSSPRITRVGKGGTDCYNMVGVSYFKQPDAKRIAEAVLEYVKDPAWAQKFWDDVVDALVKRDLDLTIHPIEPGEIVECDTVADLYALEGKLHRQPQPPTSTYDHKA